MFTIIEVYDLASQIEKNGEAFYRNALKDLSHPGLNPLFQWLAEEEVRHQKWFSQRKDSQKNALGNADSEDIGGEILKNILGNQTFSLKEADLSNIRDMVALIKLAIQFEEDTIVFFEMIRTLIEDEKTLEQLNEIIEEEKGHVRALQDVLRLRD
jgi:rubrerythrin